MQVTVISDSVTLRICTPFFEDSSLHNRRKLCGSGSGHARPKKITNTFEENAWQRMATDNNEATRQRNKRALKCAAVAVI
jgi:hypothetical protein